ALTGEDASPGYIRRACRASLRRLGTDRIDLYQLHLGELPAAQAQEVAGTLEELVADGLIRAYGWSTDDPQRAAAFAGGAHYAAVQHPLNVLADAPAMLAACDAHDLASINNGPLAMGLLTGKYGPASRLPADDVRANQPWVGYFASGRPAPAGRARPAPPPGAPPSGGRGWPGSMPSARCSPVAGAPSRRARWAGCWPAARARCPFQASGPRRRPSRTPRRCAWDRCRRHTWPRSPGCWTALPGRWHEPKVLDLEHTPGAMLGRHERHLLAQPGRRAVWLQPRHLALLRSD